MTQVTELMTHIDKQITPWIDKLQNLDTSVNGTGTGEGLKTKVAVMENGMIIMQRDIEEIKATIQKISDKVDSMMWKLAGISAVVTILTQIVFNLFSK